MAFYCGRIGDYRIYRLVYLVTFAPYRTNSGYDYLIYDYVTRCRSAGVSRKTIDIVSFIGII